MTSHHKIIINSAQDMKEIKNNSVSLVVTSPPYPMIEMWDELFSNSNQQIKNALDEKDGNLAFELMHVELDKVWKEVERILIPGGIACINIGDATRTIGKIFKLYPSHAKIIQAFYQLGFQSLPEILWRKQTNAPNKFMGSGMLPPGAYVTLEHEYILIFRKGDKRSFLSDVEKQNRRESAFFWEERNIWFSDVWDFKGISQSIASSKTRERSAAFPFDLAYRLINMFSVKGDLICDPFLGTGTTILAAIATERNSIGYEIDTSFFSMICNQCLTSLDSINEYIKMRISSHANFITDYISRKGPMKYEHPVLKTPVVTNEEVQLKINYVRNLKMTKDDEIEAEYSDFSENDTEHK